MGSALESKRFAVSIILGALRRRSRLPGLPIAYAICSFNSYPVGPCSELKQQLTVRESSCG